MKLISFFKRFCKLVFDSERYKYIIVIIYVYLLHEKLFFYHETIPSLYTKKYQNIIIILLVL
jgi:hypothetical protein